MRRFVIHKTRRAENQTELAVQVGVGKYQPLPRFRPLFGVAVGKDARLRRKLVHIINDGDVLRQRPAAVFQKRHLPHRIQLEISRFFDAGFGFRLHVVRQAGPFQRDVRHEGATAGEIMQGKHEGLL